MLQTCSNVACFYKFVLRHLLCYNSCLMITVVRKWRRTVGLWVIITIIVTTVILTIVLVFGNIIFGFQLQLTLLVFKSFQVINIILSSSNYEMIMALEARPGWPGQLLDRLGDVPLLPLFLLNIFILWRRQPTSPAPSVCTRTRTGRHGLLRSPRGSCRFSNVKNMGEQISICSPDNRHGELIREISLPSIHFCGQIEAIPILLIGYNCLLMEYVGRYFHLCNVVPVI